MILFRNEYRLHREDSKKDLKFEFDCPENINEVRVLLSFHPDALYDELECEPLIDQAVERYYDGREKDGQEMKVSSMCPLKNLITVSLSKDGIYLGNAHRWACSQMHIFTEKTSSPGFSVPEKMNGTWEGMLHLHAVCTEACDVELKVEGRRSDEMVSG